MFSSKEYWNKRYIRGGTSGAGSYNKLAQFKADVINDFVEKNQINSLIDYGVGDGNLLKLINTEKIIYTGIDVSEFIINKCKEIFKNDNTKKFIHTNNINKDLKADLVLSCDVIYHLIEDNVYKEYMNNLFSMSNKYVIIYAKDEDINHAVHVRFRKFSNYIESNFSDWKLIKHIPNKYPQLKLGENNDKTSSSDFYIYKKDEINDKIDFLITGCGSSGTKYICNLLNLNGIEVNHDFDSIGKNGFVSNAFVNDEVWIYDKKKYPLEIIKKKILITRFHNIIHIVRHPLKVIPSIICKWNNKNKIWLHIEKGVLASEKDKNINILNAMKYWVYHNKYIMKYTNKVVKLEDVIENCNNLAKYVNKSSLKQYNKVVNSSNTKEKIDWDILFNIDKDITNEIINLCKIYGYETPISTQTINLYKDEEITKTKIKNNLNEENYKIVNTSIKLPVYISLTSIFKNQNILLQTLQSIMKQTRLPDKIFLYLSEESYLLDSGFKNKKITNIDLLNFINNNSILEIRWVKNTGSYRKLLPLLKDKWQEDCIIITIDDDTIYDSNLVKNLIDDYYNHRCVIGYRGFTPMFDKIENFDYLKKNKLQNNSLYNFLTGKGGILYKPEFFYKTNDLIFNDKIYLDSCSTADDIWFYLIRILNNVKCYICDNKEWKAQDLKNNGLYLTFNSINNNNTKSLLNTYKKLKDLDYKF